MRGQNGGSIIGLDLAWSERNPSGLAALRLNASAATLELVATESLISDTEIVDWLEARRQPLTVLGIDAPIIACNPPKTARACDKDLSRDFARFEAGAFPANREKCRRPVGLRRKLEAKGFDPDPWSAPGKVGCWQLEVYPHPAQVVLFQLSKTIKYKKGPVAARRKGLCRLAEEIKGKLGQLTPGLLAGPNLAEVCPVGDWLRGRELKCREDRLDAIICAYVAAYHWWWGAERSRVYGDVRSGYIVCPRRVGA
jgi:predicted RNase H-like nuclease